MDRQIANWEDDGGSAGRLSDVRMSGTLNQIAWAVQIKANVDAEFDRVRTVLEYAMTKQSPKDATDIEAIIRILEDKRAEVMRNEEAGYFIHDWQELGNQVSRMIVGDPRYVAIKASQAERFGKRYTNKSYPNPEDSGA
jgi:hypothetical protein